MKKLFFIDDVVTVLQIQKEEMLKILEVDDNHSVEIENIHCDMTNVSDCLSDTGDKQYEGESRFNDIYKKIDDILEKVNEATARINALDDKVEVVIDLYLDDESDGLGIKLAKYICSNMNDKHFFASGNFVITITSSYVSVDFSSLCAKFLTEEDRSRIVECYRPFRKISADKYEIEKTSTAFPEFYHSFRCNADGAPSMINKLLLDKESVPGNVGTYYGNYFGLIYARLYKDERK